MVSVTESMSFVASLCFTSLIMPTFLPFYLIIAVIDNEESQITKRLLLCSIYQLPFGFIDSALRTTHVEFVKCTNKARNEISPDFCLFVAFSEDYAF